MQSVKLSSSHSEALKWLALLTMFIGHLTPALIPLYTKTGALFELIGRLAYPLFAFGLAHNLLHYSRSPWRYLRWLLIFAIIAQPIYISALNTDNLNILFTLSLGLLAIVAFQRWMAATPTLKNLCSFGAVILGLAVFAGFCDYGPAGVFLPLFWWLWLQNQFGKAFRAALVLTLLVLNHNALGLITLTVPLLVMAAWPAHWYVPRLHRFFFYGFYVVHLLAVYLLAK